MPVRSSAKNRSNSNWGVTTTSVTAGASGVIAPPLARTVPGVYSVRDPEAVEPERHPHRQVHAGHGALGHVLGVEDGEGAAVGGAVVGVGEEPALALGLARRHEERLAGPLHLARVPLRGLPGAGVHVADALELEAPLVGGLAGDEPAVLGLAPGVAPVVGRQVHHHVGDLLGLDREVLAGGVDPPPVG